MKNRLNTSNGDSGMVTVGPTGEVNRLIVTGFNVLDHTDMHEAVTVGVDGGGERNESEVEGEGRDKIPGLRPVAMGFGGEQECGSEGADDARVLGWRSTCGDVGSGGDIDASSFSSSKCTSILILKVHRHFLSLYRLICIIQVKVIVIVCKQSIKHLVCLVEPLR